MKLNVERVYTSLKELDNWIDKNGWSGYDPYDIKGISYVINIAKFGSKNYIAAIIREIIYELFYSFPVFFRKLLRVKSQINAKAMGLFALSYLDLYKVTKEKKYIHKSKECIKWLEENKIIINQGIGWGYPFAWQSAKYIPPNIPNGIVTTVIGRAFWEWYKYSKAQKYLSICVDICQFLKSLPIDKISQNNICFSYTPLFLNHVHNLNLFVAEFLIKIGNETSNNEWIDLGNKAVNYTISNQLKDGSFDYNGPPEKLQNYIDNYHTGFVLRMLHSIWQLTGRKDVFNSLKKCYYHYINNFFDDRRIPKLLTNRKYRIDIHSCAVSIDCLCDLVKTFPEGKKLADNILIWTINNLQDKSGYFYYGILKSRFTGKTFVSKIAYIRWAQAWILKAFSNFLITNL